MADGVSKKVAELVIERDRGQCVARVTHERGAKSGEQIHHRKPRRMGGTTEEWINQPANLIYVCRACHDHIESHRQQSLAMGWLIAGRDQAWNTPLRYAKDGFMYLTNDGKILRFLAEPWAEQA